MSFHDQRAEFDVLVQQASQFLGVPGRGVLLDWTRFVRISSMLVLFATSVAAGRTWTDVSGTYHTEAEFVQVVGEKVRLRKPDHSCVDVLPSQLSRNDRFLAQCLSGTSPASEGFRQAIWPDVATRDVLVFTDGSGMTADEALRDALNNAVHLASGTLTQGQTDVRNGEVSERVLLLSRGFVAQHEIIAERRQRYSVERTILATVRRREINGPREAGAGTTTVAATHLYSEALTELENRRDGRAMLERLLEQLPVDLARVELVAAPRLTQIADGRATSTCGLRVSVDEGRYARWQAEAVEILAGLATRSGSLDGHKVRVPSRLPSEATTFAERFLISGNSTSFRSEGWLKPRFLPIDVFRLTRYTGPTIEALRQDVPEEPTTVVALYLRGGRGVATTWRWFEIRVPLAQPTRGLTAVLEYLGSEATVVRTERLHLGPGLPGVSIPTQPSSSPVRAVFVSPYFVHYDGEGYSARDVKFLSGFTISHKSTFTLDELSRVRRVSVRVLSE